MKEQNLIGQQIGNYRLLRMLGRGAFAEVYLGEHRYLDIQAAIKVLHTSLIDASDIEHFRSEARLVAHLTHPHIVQVLEFGVENGIPFLVMRYAPGGMLRHLHPRGSKVALPLVTTYVKQVASALQYAHDQNLIHRDVKPENMLIGSNQEILLSDFGIALVAQSSRHRSAQEVAGTALYMAPEQFEGKARPASDQYALSIVVYEWLTGVRPFNGSFTEVASQHLFTPPTPLRERVPDIPPAVEMVVLKALAKDPALRFDSIWEFAVALEQAHHGFQGDSLVTLPVAETGASSVSETFHPAATETAPTVETAETAHTTVAPLTEDKKASLTTRTTIQERPQKRSRRALVTGLALTGLVGAGIVVGSQFTSLRLLALNVLSAPTPRPNPTARPAPVPSPTPTPPPPGTTLYTYHGHSDIVEAAAWSPDSKRIATASKDKTVQVWNASDGSNVVTYTGHTNIVDAVSWSPDGKRIVSAALDKTVRVWNAADGSDIIVYTGHTDKVAAASWSPDGKYIASAGADMKIQVWLAASGTLVCTCTGHNAKIWAVAWSPDSTRLASASTDTTVKVWAIPAGHELFTYKGHTKAVDCVAWSPDGQHIASCGDDNTAHVWNAADGSHPFIYYGHGNIVWWVAWSPNSQRLASASSDHTVQIWDASNGGNSYTYHGQSIDVYCVAWSPDGTHLASGGNDTIVQVWLAA